MLLYIQPYSFLINSNQKNYVSTTRIGNLVLSSALLACYLGQIKNTSWSSWFSKKRRMRAFLFFSKMAAKHLN